MFPTRPPDGVSGEHGLFVCQDQELRTRILPLFAFNPLDAHARPIGLGTAFRIDPWSRCVTAFHVIEDVLRVSDDGSSIELRESTCIAALEIAGSGYGLHPIPQSAWCQMGEVFSLAGIESPPLSEPRIRNVMELAALRIQPTQHGPDGTPYLPLNLRHWHPKEGDHVLALGFANLDSDLRESSEHRPISQNLSGSIARITSVERADGASGRPWPRIRVDAKWPGGMSGGPVFNEAGHVVGVVSAGIAGHGVSSATYFSGWSLPECIFGSLDPDNPGWFRCYGVFDTRGVLLRSGQDLAQIEAFARDRGVTDVSLVSIDPSTEDYIRE